MAKTIHVEAESLPEAYEQAVLSLWDKGHDIKTEYDKPEDRNSRDAMATIHVRNPMAEPRIHRGFPGGLDDLEKYRDEVLLGVHDHWIDPKAGKWNYTYHQRLFNYIAQVSWAEFNKPVKAGEAIWCEDGHPYKSWNQIESVIAKLKLAPHSRRAQAITWQVWADIDCDDPTCLQRMWFRIVNGRLDMHLSIRSNDAFKAAFMNMYAFTEVQAYVAARLGVPVGSYVHTADSFHIYGKDFPEFEQRTLKTIQDRTWDDRTWRSDDEGLALPLFVEGCDQLLREDGMPGTMAHMILARRQDLQSRIDVAKLCV